ncbi:MAG: hypothetical protein AAFQ82_16060 [Myxococcota bacterium]
MGWAGQLHPALLQPFEVEGPVYGAELSLTGLAAATGAPIEARPLPKFPSTRRDLALLAPREQASAELARFISEHAGGDLGSTVVEDVRLFDVYSGKGIPEDKVSLAFAIEYRHPARTLKDEEVNGAFQGVLDRVVKAFPVEIRQ